MDWITSDIHLNHANILKYSPDTRPYESVEEMNTSLVEQCNALIAPDDTLYILGDIIMGNVVRGLDHLEQMNGQKILIIGNHDRANLKNERFVNCFKEIHEYLMIKVDKTKVVLFHYPIFEWDAMHYGSVHLHGHTHQNLTGLEEYRVRNVGIDATGQFAVPLADIVANAKTGKIRPRCE